jgi:SAM-dependent methyltransferase
VHIPPVSVTSICRKGGARRLADGREQMHSGTALVIFAHAEQARDALEHISRGLWAPPPDESALIRASAATAAEVRQPSELQPVPARPSGAPRLITARRRAHRLSRRARELAQLEEVLLRIEHVSAQSLLADGARQVSSAPSAPIDWDAIPRSCDPCFSARRMQAGTLRGERKRETVEVFAKLLRQRGTAALVEAGAQDAPARQQPARELNVVDCGCGTGNLLLPLAALGAPRVRFVGIDTKARSLQLLSERAAAAAGRISDIETWCGQIEEYDGPCDVVLSLHACGGASDAALDLAARRGVPYIVSPCCVGKLTRGPRSRWLANLLSATEPTTRSEASVLSSEAAFGNLIAWADASSTESDARAWALRGRAKLAVEQDRLAAASEAGGADCALLEMGTAAHGPRGRRQTPTASNALASSHLSHVLVGQFGSPAADGDQDSLSRMNQSERGILSSS